jgi:hypothetical protein
MESGKMPGCPVLFRCDASIGPDWGHLTPWVRPADTTVPAEPLPAPSEARRRPAPPAVTMAPEAVRFARTR